MAQRKENGIHGMSLLVGEMKGELMSLTRMVEHLNNNWKMKDEEATRGREKLREDFDSLKGVVVEVKNDVRAVDSKIDGVQQDVAEMKNELTVAKATLDDYTTSKPMAVAAIGEVDKLKDFMASFEKKEQRVLGWWDILKRIGFVGWTIICGLGAGAVGLLFFWAQRFL